MTYGRKFGNLLIYCTRDVISILVKLPKKILKEANTYAPEIQKGKLVGHGFPNSPFNIQYSIFDIHCCKLQKSPVMEPKNTLSGINLPQIIRIVCFFVGFVTIWIHLEIRIAEINVGLTNLKSEIRTGTKRSQIRNPKSEIRNKCIRLLRQPWRKISIAASENLHFHRFFPKYITLSLLLPYYFLITSLLLPYCFPITSLLLPYCFPIASLLLPYYFPIASLLLPYYFPIAHANHSCPSPPFSLGRRGWGLRLLKGPGVTTVEVSGG
ncbi:MAG: hypothetical protein WCK09_14755 [Bacteroidota bacterium]